MHTSVKQSSEESETKLSGRITWKNIGKFFSTSRPNGSTRC